MVATEQNSEGINAKLEKETAIKKKGKKPGKNLEISEDAKVKEDELMDKLDNVKASQRRVSSIGKDIPT